MNASPLYRLLDLTKTHGPAFTLHVASLDILPGETLCLLGPTGAGKSTLLRLLAGLDSPSSGEIQFANHRLRPEVMPLSVRRRIAMVHQRPLLLSRDVAANVEYGLRVRRVLDRAEKVRAFLKKLKLERLSRQSARTLSGGETQLVALARALVIEPDVLLLDEPTAHLDPAHVALVEEVVREVQQQKTMTVVWATHNLFQARRVSERVGLLLSGQLVEVTPTQSFFEAPSDPRTADFVQGKMIY